MDGIEIINDEPEAVGPDIVEVIEDDEPQEANVNPEADTDGDEGDDQDDDTEADDDAEPEEGQPDDEAEEAEPDPVMVKLSDGTEMPLADIEKGILLEKDYRKKTSEVAEERRAVETERNAWRERMTSLEQVQSNLIPFLESLIPSDPPLSLARSNPAAYTQQQAERQAAIAELQSVMSGTEQVQGHRSQVSSEMLADWQKAEGAKLVQTMPELKDDAKRAAFDKDIRATAMELGFSEEELTPQQLGDHRTQRILHYAKLGLTREKAQQNAQNAKRRVEAPRKGPAATQAAPVKAQGDRKAMNRLRQTGSLDDAVNAYMAAARRS